MSQFTPVTGLLGGSLIGASFTFVIVVQLVAVPGIVLTFWITPYFLRRRNLGGNTTAREW